MMSIVSGLLTPGIFCGVQDLIEKNRCRRDGKMRNDEYDLLQEHEKGSPFPLLPQF